MGSGGRPSRPQQPQNDNNGVVTNKEANGFHLVEFNLDSNSDGNGVSPWSIVLIVALTIVAMWILAKIKNCFQHRAVQEKRAIQLGPLRIEPPKQAEEKRSEIIIEDEVIEQPPQKGTRKNQRRN